MRTVRPEHWIAIIRVAILLWALWAFSRGRTFTLAGAGGDWLVRDPMAMSGYLAIVLSLWVSTYVEGSVRRMFDRLLRERILDGDHALVAHLQRALMRRAAKMQWSTGAAVGACVLLGHLYFFGQTVEWSGIGGAWPIEMTVAHTVIGCLVGARFGALAIYGRAGLGLRAEGLGFSLVPGHPDRVGGTKPVSDFLLLAGAPVALVVLWLTFWLVAMGAGWPVGWVDLYRLWQWPFVAFLALALVFFWFAFVRPLWAFRELMRRSKNELLAPGMEVGDTLLRDALARRRGARSFDEFERANRGAVDAIVGMRELEALPELPLTAAARQLFRLGVWWPVITLLLDSFVSGAAGGAGVVRSLVEILRNLLT